MRPRLDQVPPGQVPLVELYGCHAILRLEWDNLGGLGRGQVQCRRHQPRGGRKLAGSSRTPGRNVVYVRMTATFPKRRAGISLCVFEWPDGSAATTPMYGGIGALPHDLGHYVGEAQFRPPYGFWNLAAQQAPFSSLTLVRGRWPGDRKEWLDRIRRKHGAEMLKAESVDLARLADPRFDFDRQWPAVARSLRNAYSFTRSNPFDKATKADFVRARELAIALNEAWQQVPEGGALVVAWPPDTPPRVTQTFDSDAITLPARSRRAKKHAARI